MTTPFSSSNIDSLGPRIQNQAIRRLSYPSPFFDLASTYLPKNVKDLFRFCEYYFLTNSLINATISKMAEYPVTDIILDLENDEIKTKWEELIEDKLNLRAFLIGVGLDYFTFGNCFVTISYPFIKLLKCKACGHEFNAEKVIDHWTFHNYKFKFNKCPHCHSRANASSRDVYVKNIPKLRLIRWDPKRILVMHNSTSGHSYYFYMMPQIHNNDLQLGRKHIVVKTPTMFIKAAKEGRPLQFNQDEIYHLKRPIISGHSTGYGMPLMLPVLKDAFFLQLLKKSQEAVALEHIVPLRIIFPQSANAQGNVIQNVVLTKWRDQIYSELLRWRRDQNYMPIIPYPVGFQSIGGDGKALMLSQEIGVWSEQIVAGMGVPREFIFGGLSYSGTNVSMRMLENSFISYRTQMKKLLKWIVHRLHVYLGWDEPNARFRDFKMADDLQRKMYLLNLNQQNKISDSTLLAESDLDQEKEDKMIAKELARRLDIVKKTKLAEAEIIGETQLVAARYQVKGQEEGAKLLQEAQARQQQEQKELQEGIQESLRYGQSPLSLAKGNPQAQFPQQNLDLRQVPGRIADQLAEMDPAKAKEWLTGLDEQYPAIAQMVRQVQEVGLGQSLMKPLPEQHPPRRLTEPI
jgi:hypothetical protein